MGRKLEFNKEKALDKATELFWKEGYANTSLKQLLKAMNMGESSFYNTFKGKKALYQSCLDHYNESYMEKRVAIITSDMSPKDRIYGFINQAIDDMDNGKCKGCLVSNSLSQDVLAEKDIKIKLFEDMDQFVSLVTETIKDGSKSGIFKKNLQPKTIATVIFTYLHGLFRLSVFNFNAEKLKSEAKTFLDSILLEVPKNSKN